VSKPPTISRDGLRSSQAIVIGQNVCQEANQPTTSSARQTARRTASGFAHRPGCAHSSTAQRSRRMSRSISTKRAARL
jgi:hypothetical protein